MSKDEHILVKKNSEKTNKTKKLRRQERITEATIQLLLKTKCAQFSAIGYQQLTPIVPLWVESMEVWGGRRELADLGECQPG